MSKNGYTLMELIVTVAVIGILASISIPSYTSYILKARRIEGRSFLMEIMQRQEKYYNENNTYVINLTQLGYSSATPNSEKDYYKVTATAATDGIANNVILTSQPIGSQTKDTECGSFIMNSNGVKSTSTGSSLCWSK